MLLRLPGQGNRELIAISATSTGYGKLHFEFESRKHYRRCSSQLGNADLTTARRRNYDKLTRRKTPRPMLSRRQSAREAQSCNQNHHRAHGAPLRTPQCARHQKSQGLMQPFSHKQTGTLLIRHLAHFVSAIHKTQKPYFRGSLFRGQSNCAELLALCIGGRVADPRRQVVLSHIRPAEHIQFHLSQYIKALSMRFSKTVFQD